MSSDDKQNDWSQDPSLSGIDFARLQALQQLSLIHISEPTRP